jgi:uncharacterized protein (DUF2237 family)
MFDGMGEPGGQQRNVFGGPLTTCSDAPKTGFFRTGCCHTGPQDVGMHTVCVVLTEAFLTFTKAAGNDLSTPRPEYGFPGLKPGDRWCLCATRFKQAHEHGKAPQVVLAATHENTLAIVPLDVLTSYAIDPI